MAQRRVVLEILSVLLIPGAIFWILYRYGLLKIIDVLAIAVVIVVLSWWVVRLLIKSKVFTFRRGG